MTRTPPTVLTSRIPDSQDAPPLRWGILGAGWIAERFTASVRAHTRQRIVAVAARDTERTAAFAERHGIVHVHSTVDGLVADDDVDIIYVATPHTAHAAGAHAAIAAGKHVLIEKPLALSAADARHVAEHAERAGVFCAEALWTLFLPRFDVVRRLVADGAIGELRTVIAEYGEYLPDEHRAMDPALAGGSLLDLGTYPIALASWLLGEPASVTAAGFDNRFGVNEQTGAIVSSESGAVAVLHTTLAASTTSNATIVGSSGVIELPGPFYQPGDVLLRTVQGELVGRFHEEAVAHDALHFEAAAVAREIAAGATQSAIRPLAASVRFLELMDAVRASAGIRFRNDATGDSDD